MKMMPSAWNRGGKEKKKENKNTKNTKTQKHKNTKTNIKHNKK